MMRIFSESHIKVRSNDHGFCLLDNTYTLASATLMSSPFDLFISGTGHGVKRSTHLFGTLTDELLIRLHIVTGLRKRRGSSNH
ncbi:MAG: hypothetical protein M3Y65_22510 [Pseudomonadota bacterium]|nr:hypothetical protein [Pseudomonadota bacterium]